MNLESSANPSICPSCYDPEVCSLLIALDELLSALTAARQSASDYGITWLQNRFKTFRRRTKAIRIKANALPEVHSQAHDDQAPPYSLN